MKKILFFGLTLSMMLMSACSSSDDAVMNEEAGVQRIVIAVENAGAGLQARAGRDLLSSEAKQSIQNLKVIITDQTTNKIVFTKEYTDWNASESQAYDTSGHGRKAEIVLTGSQKLANGHYNIYAIGYSNGSQYTMGGVALGTELAKYTKTAASPYDEFHANTVLAANAVRAEEIFAGYNSLNVAGTGIKTTVVLHRQVAGVFVYADEIPFITDAAKLSLYAADNNTSLILGNFLPENGAELATNGSNTNNKVVNGYTSAGAVTKIMSLNLSSWFTSIADANSDGMIDAGTNWIGDDTKYKNGSVFMGNFIVPFRRVSGTTTFVLKLETSADAELRTWNIKLPSGDITAGNISYWNGTDFTTTSTSASVTEYNIFRNHLYSIGTKKQEATDPDPTNDDPQTLNTKENLVLKVNDNWEVIHTMEVE